MKTILRVAISLLLASLLSCQPEPTVAPDPGVGSYYVLNEGRFLGGDAEVSIVDMDAKTVQNGLFAARNSRPLGDVAQSITQSNGRLYVVVNNSNKMEVTAPDLTAVGTVSSLASPRYFAAANATTGYVSEWGAGNFAPPSQVAVVNLATLQVTNRVAVEVLAERMLVVNGELLIASPSFVALNQLSRISLATSLALPPVTLTGSPTAMTLLSNGQLWVSTHTPNQLLRLNPTTYAVEQTIALSGTPTDLVGSPSGFLFWREGDSVWQLIAGGSSPVRLLTRPATLYGLNYYQPLNSLLIARAPSFTAQGWALRYDLTQGVVADSFQVGVAPNGFLPR